MAVQFRKPWLQKADLVTDQTVDHVLLALSIGTGQSTPEGVQKTCGHRVLREQETEKADKAAPGFGTDEDYGCFGDDEF